MLPKSIPKINWIFLIIFRNYDYILIKCFCRFVRFLVWCLAFFLLGKKEKEKQERTPSPKKRKDSFSSKSPSRKKSSSGSSKSRGRVLIFFSFLFFFLFFFFFFCGVFFPKLNFFRKIFCSDLSVVIFLL